MPNIRDDMRAWAARATKDVRFRPDREAAGRELMEHIEDKTADLMRIFPGMTEEEAMARAMGEMGEAEEISRALGKIHKPWLGYLWRASQYLLRGTACALAAALAALLLLDWHIDWAEEWQWAGQDNGRGAVVARVLYENAPAEQLAKEGIEDWKGRERLALFDIGQTRRLGEAEVTLSRAALWRMEEGTALYAEISVDYDRARDREAYLAWYLQAEDSLGNRYGHQMEYRENGASMSGFPSLGWQTRRTGHTWHLCLDGVPEEAEWVRFTYALRPASDFEFVIDLREGARS